MTRICAIALGLSSTVLALTSALPSAAQTAANGQFFQNRGEIIYQNPVNRSAGAGYQPSPAATGQHPATVYNSGGYQPGERLREFSSYGQPSINQSVNQRSSYQNSVYQNQLGYGQSTYPNPAAARQSSYNQSSYNQFNYSQSSYNQSSYGQLDEQPVGIGQQSAYGQLINRHSPSTYLGSSTNRVSTSASEKVGSAPTSTGSTISRSAGTTASVTETETAVRSTPSVESPLTPAYDASVIDYFLEVAMGAEFNSGAEIVRKWESDLRIRVNGNPTAADLQTLRSIVDEINGMNLSIRMQIVDQNPNVEMYFVPEQQFSRYEPNYRPVNMGYAWVRWNNYRISSASILISTTGVNQQERSHLIREELTQALGLLQDSYRYPDSIFYQGWTDTTAYTPLDRRVIQLLYSSMIQPGMSRAQVNAALNNGSTVADTANSRVYANPYSY